MSIIRQLAKRRLQKTQEENLQNDKDKEACNSSEVNALPQNSQLPLQSECGLGLG